ncbi:MAG: hypothetical protein AAFR67_00750 [Chloroflexota bacterium]
MRILNIPSEVGADIQCARTTRCIKPAGQIAPQDAPTVRRVVSTRQALTAIE